MKNTRIRMTIFAFLLILSNTANLFAQQNKGNIKDLWFNEEKTAKIEVYNEGDKFFGTITWVKLEEGDSGLDDQNPDPKLQSKPLIGLTILKNFVYENGEYIDGTIYDPKNGKTYSCIMKLESRDKLYVRGYIGFSLLGRTTYWTRIE